MANLKRTISSFVAAVTIFTSIPALSLTSTEIAQAAAAYPVQEFRIGISNTNRNVNIAGTTAGSQLNSWTTNGEDNEKWSLNYISAGVYEIVNSATGMVITGNGNGAVTIAADSDGAEQRWKIEGAEKDFEGYYLYYKITNNSTGQALTFVPDGNYFTTSTYSGGTYQKFKLNLNGLEGYAANAKVAGGEKAGTIGGLLGETVYVDTAAECIAAMKRTEPLTIVVTANIEFNDWDQADQKIEDDKTIIGSYAANTVYNTRWRNDDFNGDPSIAPSNNIVLQNLHFRATELNSNGCGVILVYIYSGRNIWFDHNDFSATFAHDRDNEVGKFIWINTPVANWSDGCYNGISPDYITISYNHFNNRYWTVAYGTQNTETTRDRTTLMFNKWENCARRTPQIGNGTGHVYNSYHTYSISDPSQQIIAGDGCKMLTERCYFEGLGGLEFAGGGSSSSPFRDEGSISASSVGGSASSMNKSFSYSHTWNPGTENYGYSMITAANTKNFCNKYSGSITSGDLKYITDSDMSSWVDKKYDSPFLVNIDVTDGGAVADFVDGSSWMIKNVNSGLYIDIDGAKAANGTNAQQWGASEQGIQNTFRLFEAGDGYYYIASAVGDGGTYVLDVAGKSSANGANIGIYQYNGGENQKFKFIQNSDGSYKIISKISGDKSAIEIKDAATGSGANVQQWTLNGHACQNWILEPVSNLGCTMNTSVVYEFENVNSGMVMDIPAGNMADGENVQQWSTNHFTCQQWTLQAFTGGGNYYYVRSAADPSFVLRSEGSSNGGNIGILSYSTKDSAMLFKFAKNLDGTYTIMTRSSKDACLVEVGSASIASGANVQQWEPTEHACQDWKANTFTTKTTTTTTTTTSTKTDEPETTTVTTTTAESETTTVTTTTAEPETTTVTTTTTAESETTTVTTTTTAESETTTVTTTTEPIITTTNKNPDTNVLYGDVNADCTVSLVDVVFINKANAGVIELSDYQKKNADCCLDGSINGLDATALLKYVVESIDSIPVIPA